MPPLFNIMIILNQSRKIIIVGCETEDMLKDTIEDILNDSVLDIDTLHGQFISAIDADRLARDIVNRLKNDSD